MSKAATASQPARLLAILLALSLSVGGCEKSAQKQGEDGASQVSKTDLDTLRSLPYAGGYETNEDEVGGVVFRDEQRSCPGYTLYGIHKLSAAELIDEDGHVVKSWSHADSQAWERAELLPNGDLLAIGSEPSYEPDGQRFPGIADDSRYVLRMNWEGELLWKQKIHAHHDIELTPDGKLLVLTFERREVPYINETVPVRDDELTLLRQDGTVIQSRSILRAVARSTQVIQLQPMGPTSHAGPPWVDLFHANSVEWMRYGNLVGKDQLYDLSNILICLRHQDRIAIFNWPRREIVWAWGWEEISGPHDAHMLENGHILLFDNGIVNRRSRAVELDPVTKQIVWEYQADPPTSFFTLSQGSVQRLPNGNTLMAESDKGRAIEVTPEGETVWEFICPHKLTPTERAAIVRITRYPRPFIDAIISEHQD